MGLHTVKQLQTLEDKIAEKVGYELLDLIGQEKWTALIKSVTDEFMTNKAPRIIQDMLIKELQKQVIDKLKLDTASDWSANAVNPIAKEFMISVMKEAGATILANMFQNQVQQAIFSMNQNNGY